MDLFGNKITNFINILPEDGEVFYFGKILTSKKAAAYFNFLAESVPWKNDEMYMFGKHIITKRKVAWYSDNQTSYTYSNSTKNSLIWTRELLELKELVEHTTKESFNSCLLNLYPSGDEGMGWHSDNEKSLEENSAIASLSLGAERIFSLKNKKTGKTIRLNLEAGSLLMMAGQTQTFWLHSLPKIKKVKEPRINLTFRRMENT